MLPIVSVTGLAQEVVTPGGAGVERWAQPRQPPPLGILRTIRHGVENQSSLFRFLVFIVFQLY